jgi:hypothetical protein
MTTRALIMLSLILTLAVRRSTEPIQLVLAATARQVEVAEVVVDPHNLVAEVAHCRRSNARWCDHQRRYLLRSKAIGPLIW